MKHFKKMLEVVNQQGEIRSYSPSAKNIKPDPGATKMFMQMVKDAQVFVFSPNEDGPTHYNGEFEFQRNDLEGGMPEIDAPFKTFSIEMSEGPIAVGAYERDKFSIECMLVHEVYQPMRNMEPDKLLMYWIIMLARLESEGENWLQNHIVTADIALDINPNSPEFAERLVPVVEIEGQLYSPTFEPLRILQKFLNRLNREASGQERVHFRTKLRAGGKKEFIKIRRIIHIAPKKTEKLYAGKLAGAEPREIEWSHSWFSRGHWRRLEPGHIGKNRTGDYVELGRTWVTDSIKGPDHLPMVKKTYVVDGESC